MGILLTGVSNPFYSHGPLVTVLAWGHRQPHTEVIMLFALIYNGTSGTEDAEKRSLDIFKNWTPPAGFEFKSHWAFADTTGGVAIVEVDSAETMLAATAPFQVYNDFTIRPIVDIEAAVPIFDKGNAWRDSIG